jgi:hypothetical protein
VAAVAVLVFVFVFAAGGDDGGGSSGPEGAAEQLLQAGVDRDIGAAQDSLCQDDLSSGYFADNLEDVAVESYEITSSEDQGDFTVVHVSMTTPDGPLDDVEIPVVEEDGEWKVCFQRMLGDVDLPEGSDSGSDLTIPEDGITIPGPSSGSGTDFTVPSSLQRPSTPL